MADTFKERGTKRNSKEIFLLIKLLSIGPIERVQNNRIKADLSLLFNPFVNSNRPFLNPNYPFVYPSNQNIRIYFIFRIMI